MYNKIYSFLVCCILWYSVFGQDNNYGVKGFYPQTFELTDTSNFFVNGLKAGYEIKEIETESKKEDQTRYRIYFYLTNIGTEAKIMYQNMDFGGHAGPINNNLALFKCMNATGARFTNKMASMELQPCYMMAKVEDKDCANGKVVINTRSVNIGYWIKPGETVSKTYKMYVPQNEKPNVTVTFYPEVANQTGTFMQSGNQQTVQQVFVRLKNFATNTYLNNQSGFLQCTTMEQGWWSADWEIIPIQGTDNFYIRNRWKNTYLTADNGWLSDSPNNTASIWSIQETQTPNVFYIKRINNNARIYIEGGQLKISSNYLNNENLSKWLIEK